MHKGSMMIFAGEEGHPGYKRTKRAAGKKICSDGNYNIIINRIWDIYDNPGKCISTAER